MQEPPEQGQRFALLSALFDSKVTIAAVGFIVLILVLAVVGEAIAPFGANEINVINQLQPPSLTHFFGTDDLGRDVFSRVIIAARPSVMVSVVSVSLALIAGVSIGLASGFFGGDVQAGLELGLAAGLVDRAAEVLVMGPMGTASIVYLFRRARR